MSPKRNIVLSIIIILGVINSLLLQGPLGQSGPHGLAGLDVSLQLTVIIILLLLLLLFCVCRDYRVLVVRLGQ